MYKLVSFVIIITYSSKTNQLKVNAMYYLDIVDMFKKIDGVTRVGKTVNIAGDHKDDPNLKVVSFTYNHIGVAKEVQKRINRDFVDRYVQNS